MAFEDAPQNFMVSIREVPAVGPARVLVRTTDEDRELISDAARVVGMSQQKFMRALLVSGARQVLKEAGIEA